VRIKPLLTGEGGVDTGCSREKGTVSEALPAPRTTLPGPGPAPGRAEPQPPHIPPRRQGCGEPPDPARTEADGCGGEPPVTGTALPSPPPSRALRLLPAPAAARTALLTPEAAQPGFPGAGGSRTRLRNAHPLLPPETQRQAKHPAAPSSPALPGAMRGPAPRAVPAPR